MLSEPAPDGSQRVRSIGPDGNPLLGPEVQSEGRSSFSQKGRGDLLSDDDNAAGDEDNYDRDGDVPVFEDDDLLVPTEEEAALRRKITAVLSKFDVSNLGVLSTQEAERILLQLGVKPADVPGFTAPVTDEELEAIVSFVGGSERLSSFGRRDRTIVDIGVLSERIACQVEGTTIADRAGFTAEPEPSSPPEGGEKQDAAAADGEAKPAAPPERKRRGSIEAVFNKYIEMSSEDIHNVGAVKSILDTRLNLIVKEWRRAFCDNTARRVWDLLHLAAIIFVFITITWYNYRHQEREPLVLWGIFLLCHVLFALDMVGSCVLFARNPVTQKIVKGTKDIMKARKGQLLMDLIAFVPVDMVLWWFAERSNTFLIIFLCFRGLKMFKLPRILSLFEIVNTDVLDASAVTFYYQLRPIIRGFAISVLTLHVLVVLVHLAHETYTNYLEALMFTMSMLFGAGPSVEWDTQMDYVMMMVLMPISVILRGIVIGKISVFLFEGDVSSQNLVVMQDTLALLRHYDCPPELQQEILSFQRHLVSDDISHHLSVLGELPKEMQEEMQTCMKITALSSIPFLRTVGSDVRIDLANSMERYHADPGEILVSLGETQSKAFIVVHGSVDILGPTSALLRTVDAPGFVGETALLGSDEVPARYSARAVSYADLWVIPRAEFHRILTSHVSVGMSIEEYYGPEHPFVQFLETVFGEYCDRIQAVAQDELAAAEEIADFEASRRAKSSAEEGNVDDEDERRISAASVQSNNPAVAAQAKGAAVAASRWLHVFKNVNAKSAANLKRDGSTVRTAVSGTFSADDRARGGSVNGGPSPFSPTTSQELVTVGSTPSFSRLGSQLRQTSLASSTGEGGGTVVPMQRRQSRFQVLARAVLQAPRSARERLSSHALLARSVAAGGGAGGDGGSATDGASHDVTPEAGPSEQTTPRNALGAGGVLLRSSPKVAQRSRDSSISDPPNLGGALQLQPSGTHSLDSAPGEVPPAKSMRGVPPASSVDILAASSRSDARSLPSLAAGASPANGVSADYVRHLEHRLDRAMIHIEQLNGVVASLTASIMKSQGIQHTAHGISSSQSNLSASVSAYRRRSVKPGSGSTSDLRASRPAVTPLARASVAAAAAAPAASPRPAASPLQRDSTVVPPPASPAAAASGTANTKTTKAAASDASDSVSILEYDDRGSHVRRASVVVDDDDWYDDDNGDRVIERKTSSLKGSSDGGTPKVGRATSASKVLRGSSSASAKSKASASGNLAAIMSDDDEEHEMLSAEQSLNRLIDADEGAQPSSVRASSSKRRTGRGRRDDDHDDVDAGAPREQEPSERPAPHEPESPPPSGTPSKQPQQRREGSSLVAMSTAGASTSSTVAPPARRDTQLPKTGARRQRDDGSGASAETRTAKGSPQNSGTSRRPTSAKSPASQREPSADARERQPAKGTPQRQPRTSSASPGTASRRPQTAGATRGKGDRGSGVQQSSTTHPFRATGASTEGAAAAATHSKPRRSGQATAAAAASAPRDHGADDAPTSKSTRETARLPPIDAAAAVASGSRSRDESQRSDFQNSGDRIRVTPPSAISRARDDTTRRRSPAGTAFAVSLEDTEASESASPIELRRLTINSDLADVRPGRSGSRSISTLGATQRPGQPGRSIASSGGSRDALDEDDDGSDIEID